MYSATNILSTLYRTLVQQHRSDTKNSDVDILEVEVTNKDYHRLKFSDVRHALESAGLRPSRVIFIILVHFQGCH